MNDLDKIKIGEMLDVYSRKIFSFYKNYVHYFKEIYLNKLF